MAGDLSKAATEVSGLLRRPQRTIALARKIVSDKLRITFDQRNLYSYTTYRRDTASSLRLLLRWILNAQRPDGGIAAYYSLLTGYSKSYPEVTGYIIPTLYDVAKHDFATAANNKSEVPATEVQVTKDRLQVEQAAAAAELATQWLLSLQRPDGAFPAGLHGTSALPSVFNTGQILQGLVRAHKETHRANTLNAAVAAADWLVKMQQPDGSWSGPGAYQNSSHTYYSMVAWALAQLSEHNADRRYAVAAGKNLDWVLPHIQSSGWVDGINLSGHPNYLHFVAYVLQGVLECGILLRRSDAIAVTAKSAWILLRKFETNKFLPGAYEAGFYSGHRFTCLTGNAQMACVWLRLYEVTDDLRYLNAALKINEMLKGLLPLRGSPGIAGGVSGSYPIWGRYQRFRYISWGCKFLADALLLEQRLMRAYEAPAVEALSCAS
jgi:hypothetical protein